MLNIRIVINEQEKISTLSIYTPPQEDILPVLSELIVKTINKQFKYEGYYSVLNYSWANSMIISAPHKFEFISNGALTYLDYLCEINVDSNKIRVSSCSLNIFDGSLTDFIYMYANKMVDIIDKIYYTEEKALNAAEIYNIIYDNLIVTSYVPIDENPNVEILRDLVFRLYSFIHKSRQDKTRQIKTNELS